jgi:rare lipoprotein A
MIETETGSRRTLVALAAGAALLALPSVADAKRPGGRHCVKGTCHRVMTLSETEALIGRAHRIKASHYDDCRRDRFNPCGLTSSGEVFRPRAADNTASSIHPDGTVLLLRNPATGLAAIVRVNNFGPFRGDRKLDVSTATAERLGFARRGVAVLETMVVHAPSPAETRYAYKRRYAPVAGFIGHTASLDGAYAGYAGLAAKPTRLAGNASDVQCHLSARRRAPPRLKLIAAMPARRLTHLAGN